MSIIRLSPEFVEEFSKRIAPRGVAVGPKGGRYRVGSEKTDSHGHKVRSYVGNKAPGGGDEGQDEKPEGYSRWAEHVRVKGGRDARLPTAGTDMTRHFRGQEVKVVEGPDGFTVHVDGKHVATGRSLTGALSRALGRGVSGYSFMRLGGAQEAGSGKLDWKAIGEGKTKIAEHARKTFGEGAKVVTEHLKDGRARAHVHEGGKHYIVEADENGAPGQTYREEGRKWVKEEGKAKAPAYEPDAVQAADRKPGFKIPEATAEAGKAYPEGHPGKHPGATLLLQPRLAYATALAKHLRESGVMPDAENKGAGGGYFTTEIRSPSKPGVMVEVTKEGIRINRDVAKMPYSRIEAEQIEPGKEHDIAGAVAKHYEVLDKAAAAESERRKVAKLAAWKRTPEGRKAGIEDDAKAGTIPHEEAIEHLKEQGFHDASAAKDLLELRDKGDWAEAISTPDHTQVKHASDHEVGAVVHAATDGKHTEFDESWAARHLSESLPHARYEGGKFVIPRNMTEDDGGGKTRTVSVKDSFAFNDLPGGVLSTLQRAHVAWRRKHDAIRPGYQNLGIWKVEKHTKTGTILQNVTQAKKRVTVPHDFPMAPPLDPKARNVLQAVSDGRIAFTDASKGGLDTRLDALPPAVRHTLRQMNPEDARTVRVEASEKAKGDAKKVARLIDAAKKHGDMLQNWHGIKDTEIHVHPDAIRLTDKDGNEYAKFGHDFEVHEPSVRRITNWSNSHYHPDPTPTTARKALDEWTYHTADSLMLKSLFADTDAPEIPDGYAAVLFDPESRRWQAVRDVQDTDEEV